MSGRAIRRGARRFATSCARGKGPDVADRRQIASARKRFITSARYARQGRYKQARWLCDEIDGIIPFCLGAPRPLMSAFVLPSLDYPQSICRHSDPVRRQPGTRSGVRLLSSRSAIMIHRQRARDQKITDRLERLTEGSAGFRIRLCGRRQAQGRILLATTPRGAGTGHRPVLPVRRHFSPLHALRNVVEIIRRRATRRGSARLVELSRAWPQG